MRFGYILFLSSCELWDYGYTFSTGMYDCVGCECYPCVLTYEFFTFFVLLVNTKITCYSYE